MAHSQIDRLSGSIRGGRILALVRRRVAALVLLALISLLAAPTMASTCVKACSITAKACSTSAKMAGKGCAGVCKVNFLNSPGEAADQEAFDACRNDCSASKDSAIAACLGSHQACGTACENTASGACTNSCSTILFNCGAHTLATTKACKKSCTRNDWACAAACGTGNAASHVGLASALNCFNNGSTGFFACMNSGCTGVCGNGFVELGEECDDNNTTNGDLCDANCFSEDLDGDLISKDGDGSGVGGDNPCGGGNTTGCDDNCPYQANPTQADSDDDGVGDLCDYNCTGASGATIDGGVYLDSVAPANLLPNSPVSACRTDHSCCSYTVADASGAYQFLNLSAGDYAVTASPEGNILPGGLSPVTVSGTGSFLTDLVVHAPTSLPSNATFGNAGVGTVPSAGLGADEDLTVTGCSSAANPTWEVIQLGGVIAQGLLSEDQPGVYSATIPGTAFATAGPREVVVSLDCPGGTEITNFDIYIDPSGFVRFVNGDPAPGATMTLLRSETPLGPFVVVPDGSSIMSPQNRNNPDLSDAIGHFGWDVIAGYYKVHAEFGGCTVESHIMQIPPPVTDLDLVLDCPCIAGPQPGCRTATKGSLSVKDYAVDTKDAFQWRWSPGVSTGQAEFGTPTASTSYDVCVYAGSNQPLLALEVPADNEAWKATGSDGTKGYSYRDRDGLSSGVTKVVFKAGADNNASVLVKGKGMALPDATLGNLATPIVVQLQRTDSSVCFESSFSLGAILENSAAKLNAKVR